MFNFGKPPHLSSFMIPPQELRARLERFPRLKYATFPTPLEPMENLTRELGGPRLWVKRDDGIGPGLGGSKGRKLEFLMAEALARKAHRVITYGGLQSNHARMTAAACAALGLEAHLFFFDRCPADLPANLLLDHLFGARLHFLPLRRGGSAPLTIERTSRLIRLVSTVLVGPGAYFMPVGGHSVTGCLGYVAAALELHQQVEEIASDKGRVTVVTGVGTGGTLAGLMAGLKLLESPVRVLGIDVGKLWKAFPASLAKLAGDLCAALGEPRSFQPDDVPMIEGKYVGPGYAVYTSETGAAIRIMAQAEGLLLDPVYSGKAFAGLLDLIGKGRFGADETIIFLHTGGLPGLWAFEEPLSK